MTRSPRTPSSRRAASNCPRSPPSSPTASTSACATRSATTSASPSSRRAEPLAAGVGAPPGVADPSAAPTSRPCIVAVGPLETPGRPRGCGAAGSAPHWQCGGQGFESPQLHPCDQAVLLLEGGLSRSEERRVGKECRSRWSPYHYKKKQILAMDV